jgi:hypothetical protein
MKTARAAAACLALLALALPTAAEAGFGPTEPLAENAPQAPSHPVYAFRGSNNKLHIYGPQGELVEVNTPARNIDNANIHTSSNARGDSLVTWTENGSGNHIAYAIFWPANASAPNAAHELLTGGTVTVIRPWSVLDPDGSATVVWHHNNRLMQVTTQDAGAADPWPEPTELGRGGAAGASLPDGRSVLGIIEEVPLTNPQPGRARFWRAHGSTRMEGQPFKPPAVLSGGDPDNLPTRFVHEAWPVVAITPGGRGLVAYRTTLNGDNGQCNPYERMVHAATTPVTNAEPNFTQQVVGGPVPDPYELTGVRAGSDDRLAIVWREAIGCHVESNRPTRYMAAYIAPGQTSWTPTGEGIPNDATFRGFWFRTNGDLLFWTQTSNPVANRQTIFTTGVPITDPGTQNPPPPNGGDGGNTNPPPTGGGSGTPLPPPTTPGGTGSNGGGTAVTPTVIPVVPSKFTASLSGVVKTSVKVPGPGDLAMDLLARRSGLVKSAPANVKVASFKKKVTKAGKIAVTLKLNARAKKTLKAKGKLKVTVTTSFTPTGGKVVKKTTTVVLKSRK